MSGTLIKNGLIFSDGHLAVRDIAFCGGKISGTGIFNPADFPGYEVIDASGRYIFPGGIDPHVHLALPTPAGNSADNFYSGSRAALFGGTTTLFDFVTPRRGGSLRSALQARRAETKNSQVNTFLHLGISEWNGAIRKELMECVEKEDIKSVKCYLAYPETIGIGYSDLREIMIALAGTGVVVMVHSEDGEMIRRKQEELAAHGQVKPADHAVSRPVEAEIQAISRVAEMTAQTGGQSYIVHISSRKGAEIVKAAKSGGITLYAETCPQYLLLDDSVYRHDKQDQQVLPFVLSPPIRDKSNQEGLWEAVSDGTIDVVATDHCPFNLKGQKDLGINDFRKIPNGAGGIEHRLGLLFTYGVATGKIGMERFIDLVSTIPARIFGLGDQKGRLDSGFDADIVIWNPSPSHIISTLRHQSLCDSDIYDGMAITGQAEKIFIHGTNQTILD